MPHQGRSPQVYLEGLVAHKDFAIQGEAQLAALEEHGVCLRQLAVCMHQASVRGAVLSLACEPHVFAQAVPHAQLAVILQAVLLLTAQAQVYCCTETSRASCVYSMLAQGVPCPYANHAQNSS